jgi:hypothetical protein
MMIIINVLLKKGSAVYTVILVVGIEIDIAGGIRPIHRWDMKLRFRRWRS